MPSSTSQHPDKDGGNPLDIERAIDALCTSGDDSVSIETLSDLGRLDASLLKARWSDIPADTRLTIIRDMVSDAEANVERNYHRIMLVALDDSNPDIRLAAVDGLWELESEDFLSMLLERAPSEPDDRVRAAEAMSLGRFALLCELEELGITERDSVRSTLLTLLRDQSREVRRRALESAGYLSGDPEISAEIERGYTSGDHIMQVSAVHAMGRQADARWLEIVHRELGSDDPELRFEAVQAAGMIGDERSVAALIDMLRDEDGEVRMAAIAAIGSIGGKLAVNTLRRLAKDDDPAVVEAADDALEEALIASNPLRPLM